MGRWVHTWASAPQLTEPENLPPHARDGLVLDGSTLRQTVRISAGGERLRLRFSNAFGTAPLRLAAVTVALPVDGRAGGSAVVPETLRAVTFHGRPTASVPAGAQVVSDPLEFSLADGAVLAVTLRLAEGLDPAGVTSHPGSRTTSHLAAGDQTGRAELTGATPVEHWYLLSGVEVEAPVPVLALIGDSLTDGRGSTTNHNDRWPDQLFDRLGGFAVANQAAGGNRVLNDGLGQNALARLDRDILALSGVRWLVVFEGVNDLGTAPAEDQEDVAADLIAAYEQIAVRAHAHDILVYGATLTPFGGHDYDDPAGHRESARQKINTWIRTSGTFDAVLDFDQAVRDPSNPRRLLPSYDVGDHLHLSPTGYHALANAFPAHLLKA